MIKLLAVSRLVSVFTPLPVAIKYVNDFRYLRYPGKLDMTKFEYIILITLGILTYYGIVSHYYPLKSLNSNCVFKYMKIYQSLLELSSRRFTNTNKDPAVAIKRHDGLTVVSTLSSKGAYFPKGESLYHF